MMAERERESWVFTLALWTHHNTISTPTSIPQYVRYSRLADLDIVVRQRTTNSLDYNR